MKWHNRFRIVSFYTPDYEEYARGLIRSIEKHLPKIPYEIEPIDQCSWTEATCRKGQFVFDKLRESDRPVVWIDADAEVKTDLAFPDVDFAIYARFADPLRKNWSPFRTGTVYFGRSQAAGTLAMNWALHCGMRDDGIDQWALFDAWIAAMDNRALPSTVWLPLAYCQKVNESGPAKIVHNMASRTLKHKK